MYRKHTENTISILNEEYAYDSYQCCYSLNNSLFERNIESCLIVFRYRCVIFDLQYLESVSNVTCDEEALLCSR